MIYKIDIGITFYADTEQEAETRYLKILKELKYDADMNVSLKLEVLDEN